RRLPRRAADLVLPPFPGVSLATVGHVFAFGLVASLNPSLLTAVTVMLTLERPRRLLSGYLAGQQPSRLLQGEHHGHRREQRRVQRGDQSEGEDVTHSREADTWERRQNKIGSASGQAT